METKIIQTKGFFELEEKYGTHDGDIVRVLVEIDYEKKSVHIKPRFGGDHFIFKNQHIRLEMWSSLGKLIAEASEFAKKQLENYEADCTFQKLKREIIQLSIEPPHNLPTGKFAALWRGDKVIIQNTIPPSHTIPPSLNFFPQLLTNVLTLQSTIEDLK